MTTEAMYLMGLWLSGMALIYVFCVFTQYFGDWMRATERLHRKQIKQDLRSIVTKEEFSEYRRSL